MKYMHSNLFAIYLPVNAPLLLQPMFLLSVHLSVSCVPFVTAPL